MQGHKVPEFAFVIVFDEKSYCLTGLIKSLYNFLISQPKHLLWVLKRNISMRLFFWAPKTYAENYG